MLEVVTPIAGFVPVLTANAIKSLFPLTPLMYTALLAGIVEPVVLRTSISIWLAAVGDPVGSVYVKTPVVLL